MPLKKEPSGRRSMQVEVEVPGTPEQVWQAIATGPGISSWFVPTRMETDASGKPVRIFMSFGPGMDSEAKVTAWDPPHQFSAESAGLGPEAPPLATEWSVEARGGGKCLVRVVHSLFAASDDWDGELEGTEHGWPCFFRLLRLYLAHFMGQPCAAFQLMGQAAAPAEAALAAFNAALGSGGAAVGERMAGALGVPPLAGLVEGTGQPGSSPELLLRLDHPAPCLAHLIVVPMGGPVMLSLRFFFYGPQAAEVARRDEPLWQAWMAERFPMPQMGGASCS